MLLLFYIILPIVFVIGTEYELNKVIVPNGIKAEIDHLYASDFSLSITLTDK